MPIPFINREREFKELDSLAKKAGLVVVFGRRRVGKSRLLTQWLKPQNGLYTQAIESDAATQLDQVYNDIKSNLSTNIRPKNWSELFELLSQSSKRVQFCIDEFPYLVATDPSLPSVFQKWLDHENENVLLILSGSSNHMMHDLFLNRSAPLFGRTLKTLKIEPMGYLEFCRALKFKPKEKDSFVTFSLVGGIPRYWEFLSPKDNPIESAQKLFFDFAPFMESEPQRYFADEKIIGSSALNLLECVGRGAEKPSEMAARMGTAQTNLSKVLQQLLDASVLERQVPYGQSHRNAKKVLYKISDPTLRFWFSVYSPHRVRWNTYKDLEKMKLLEQHASTVFEDYCRSNNAGSGRYWDKNCEFDLVRNGTNDSELIISEVKFRKLSAEEKRKTLEHLERRWHLSELHKSRHWNTHFEILDLDTL